MAKRKRLVIRWPVIMVMTTVMVVAPSCETQLGLETIGIVSVDIVPMSAVLTSGDTLRFLGIATDENGVGYAGSAPLWMSSDPSVAVVSQSGLVTAVGSGTATISADVLDLTGTATVDVIDPPFIVLATNSLAFVATQGAADPVDQVVAFSNGGSGTPGNVTVGPVIHAAGQPGGWLTADLANSPDELLIRVSINGLSAGTYDATVGIGISGRIDGTLTVSLVIS